MSLANKILLGVIGVAAAAFFFMGARTLRTHQHWRELVQQNEAQIKRLRDDSRQLVEGMANRPGIRQLQVEVARLLVDRSRAWFKCDAKVNVNPDGTAEVTVTTDKPDPNGITANATLYAFEEADIEKEGRYLGEFKVTKSDPAQKQVVLAPTSPLDAGERDRLAKAQPSWVLYEVMPHDNREIEPVRDYQVLFSAARAQKTLLQDRIDLATRDNLRMADALARAKEQEAAIQRDVASTEQGVKKMQGERDVVVAYLKLLDTEFAATKAAIAGLIHANKAMAGQIAVLQKAAVRRIDERSRAMARSNAGGQ